MCETVGVSPNGQTGQAMTVKVERIKRHAGIAGQFSVTADVTYPGEATERIEFVGSTYGGPVVMVTPAGSQLFVTDPERFGTFGPEWVRRFFAPAELGSAVAGLLVAFPALVILAYVIGAVIGIARVTS